MPKPLTTFLYWHTIRWALLTALLCCCSTYTCRAQMTKTTSQTIPIDDARSLRVDVRNAKVFYKKSKGKRIIIEAEIQLSVPNETLLNYIISNGRYELRYSIDPDTHQLLLTSLREKDLVIVRGEVCQERVVYTIYVPASLRSQTQ